MASALWRFAASLPPFDLTQAALRSTVVLDRQGDLLRPFATAGGRWRLPVSADKVDPRMLEMLRAYEDRRFADHSGIDPAAAARAAWQWLRHGRIVSGGSTLSMQVARLVEPRPERSLTQKLRQMIRAVELERRLGKRGVLDLYLALAPYGGSVEGLRAASLAYFGREPARLSFAEAALLVALPQAPEARRPDRFPAAARRARDRVLDIASAQGVITVSEAAAAKAEPVPTAKKPFPMVAAHAAEEAVAADPGARIVRLTLDGRLQTSLESLAAERAAYAGPDLSAAILVIDNASGAVLAQVGSAGYLDARRRGAIDMTQAVRSPGSALKPFIYALAFEAGIAHPETLMEDRPARYAATYAPENFDLTYQGTVSARRALQLSLNVPAVDLLEAVGPARFIARLRSAGAGVVLPRDTAPGLPVALGGLGITLTDVARLFSGLARGGVMPDLVRRLDEAACLGVAMTSQPQPRPECLADKSVSYPEPHPEVLRSSLEGGLQPACDPWNPPSRPASRTPQDEVEKTTKTYRPDSEVPAKAGLEGALRLSARSLEPSFEAAGAAPQDEVASGRTPCRLPSDRSASGTRVAEPVAAWYVADILRGAPPPENALPNRIAYKTGTSYGYRDAWAVGFDRRVTVAVWVGRADGAAVSGLVGRVVAAPILFDAFARYGGEPVPVAQARDALIATNAALPSSMRHLRKDVPAATAGTTPLKIAYPPDGARIDLGLSDPGAASLALKALGGVPPLTWMVDGLPVAQGARRQSEWRPDGAGFARLSVMDASGASDSVVVRIE